MCQSMCLSIWQSICLSMWLSIRQSMCQSMCLSICQSMCQFMCLSVCQSICHSICQSMCQSMCLSVRLSVCLSVCLSICILMRCFNRAIVDDRLSPSVHLALSHPIPPSSSLVGWLSLLLLPSSERPSTETTRVSADGTSVHLITKTRLLKMTVGALSARREFNSSSSQPNPLHITYPLLLFLLFLPCLPLFTSSSFFSSSYSSYSPSSASTSSTPDPDPLSRPSYPFLTLGKY